jgi:ubiquinone/menaquinone biosynthesis C-methylase UbiE
VERESLLDLACGTGFVTFGFGFVRRLQLDDDGDGDEGGGREGKVKAKGKIVGVDISSGMLRVARAVSLLERSQDLGVEVECVSMTSPTFLYHRIPGDGREVWV